MTSAVDPADELVLLRTIVDEASELVLRLCSGHFDAWRKSDGSGLVTEVDLAVDEHLKRRLLEFRPDYAGCRRRREDDPARLDRGRVFVVDPIDGTNSLARGTDDFSHKRRAGGAGNADRRSRPPSASSASLRSVLRRRRVRRGPADFAVAGTGSTERPYSAPAQRWRRTVGAARRQRCGAGAPTPSLTGCAV